MQGFVVTDHFGERDKDVIAGLKNTPAALIGLVAGENRGKRMVKV
jgi:NADPH-dependent curcumin reductase CurA